MTTRDAKPNGVWGIRKPCAPRYERSEYAATGIFNGRNT